MFREYRALGLPPGPLAEPLTAYRVPGGKLHLRPGCRDGLEPVSIAPWDVSLKQMCALCDRDHPHDWWVATPRAASYRRVLERLAGVRHSCDMNRAAMSEHGRWSSLYAFATSQTLREVAVRVNCPDEHLDAVQAWAQAELWPRLPGAIAASTALAGVDDPGPAAVLRLVAAAILRDRPDSHPFDGHDLSGHGIGSLAGVDDGRRGDALAAVRAAVAAAWVTGPDADAVLAAVRLGEDVRRAWQDAATGDLDAYVDACLGYLSAAERSLQSGPMVARLLPIGELATWAHGGRDTAFLMSRRIVAVSDSILVVVATETADRFLFDRTLRPVGRFRAELFGSVPVGVTDQQLRDAFVFVDEMDMDNQTALSTALALA